MNFSLYIAKRYLRSKSSNNAINFITIVAVIGVVLGATSLFIVLSGFAGLKDFTLQFTTIIDPSLKAETVNGKTFALSKDQVSKLNAIEDIASYSKIIEERIFINFNNKNYLTAKIKGVDKNFQKVVDIDSVIDYGSWLEQKSNQIVVGQAISNNLSMGVLDFSKAVNIYVPKPGKGQITSTKNAFNIVKALNVGIFSVNESMDDTYVFAPLGLAQRLLNYRSNQISGIEFKLNKDADETATKDTIKNILGHNVVVKNRAQLNDALYKMLNTENLAVYLIFTLVLIIAFFNIVGSLIMMMLDKKKSLNTLLNIGASIKDLRRIFFLQGSLMSVIGGVIGLVLAFFIVILQKEFSLVMITQTLPYPVTIKIENFFIVFFTISVLGIIASKLASVRITKPLIQTQ